MSSYSVHNLITVSVENVPKVRGTPFLSVTLRRLVVDEYQAFSSQRHCIHWRNRKINAQFNPHKSTNQDHKTFIRKNHPVIQQTEISSNKFIFNQPTPMNRSLTSPPRSSQDSDAVHCVSVLFGNYHISQFELDHIQKRLTLCPLRASSKTWAYISWCWGSGVLQFHIAQVPVPFLDVPKLLNLLWYQLLGSAHSWERLLKLMFSPCEEIWVPRKSRAPSKGKVLEKSF